MSVTISYQESEPASQVLQRSGGFCKVPVSWEYRGSHICFVKVDGQVVSESTGGSKAEARDKATSLAVSIMQKHCYTIQVKSPYLSDGTEVDMMDVQMNTEVGGKSEAIGGGNVGHRLLRLMGWAGGGLGREGAGRAEPVTASKVFGREGLGSSQAGGRHFNMKIEKIIQVGLLGSLLQLSSLSSTCLGVDGQSQSVRPRVYYRQYK